MPTAIPIDPVFSDSLIVVLSRENAGTNLVRSVQMVSGDMRNSYCFRAGRSLDSAFAPEFTSSVISALDRQTTKFQLVDEPQFAFSLPGIGISGLRIDPQREVDDVSTVTLHFKRYVGDLSRVLLFERSFELPPATVRERIAVEVLRDIVSPIFDILSLSGPTFSEVVRVHSAAIQARLDRLEAQQEEIEFYSGLLKRYVAGCQEDAAEMQSKANDHAESMARKSV